ncbi:putative inorganic phosphate cotransporter [Anastrepha ludens]|uniref:putative inorganic phosphate cotransporter n=1 Tax=Anastrepha ludens TaxID=28586 RepID=UPI0023B0B173|nr:putative inorganic phosphate cotransporter [Anastrepha ludens]
MFQNLGFRHLQTLLLFGTMSVVYALRVNLSVAIVVMTDKQSNPDFEEYAWSEHIKGLLLSSFFIGYVIAQIPCGYLSRKCGGKVLLLICLVSCSLLAILTPVCATIGSWQLVLASRILQGIFQGAVFPSVHTILSKWSPVDERALMSSCTYSGCQFGTFVMLASSGVLAASRLGWPSIFYISGTIGLLWAVIFKFFACGSPKECRRLSEREHELIFSHWGNSELQVRRNSMHPPWTSFFKSCPFWALTTVHCTNNWGLWTLLTYMPVYVKNILHMDIEKNALSSALPYFAMWILSFVFTALSLWLNQRKCMSLETSRKLFNTIGHGTPAVTLIALGYMDADHVIAAVALLTVTVGISSASYLGYQINHIDLSPNFAGILMGISNCLANITGIVAPLTVALIVTNEKSVEQWRIIFFLASFLYLLGNTVFLIFANFEVQPWNDPTD